MSRIMFVTWSGGGNQPPAVGLAQQLRRLGHDVVFAGYPDQAGRLEALGFGFTTLARSAAPTEPFDPGDLLGWLTRHVWACPDHLADTAEVLQRHDPDLVVVDCLMTGVLAAAETYALPSVALVHSAPGALAPPAGPLDQIVLPGLNRLRAEVDLAPVESLWQAWQRHTVANASIPELDPAGAAAFTSDSWIGPVFVDPEPSGWAPGPGDDGPVVLVSFSTGIAWDQTSRIERTLDGLAGTRLRLVVTSGATDPAGLRVPTGPTTVVRYLPHGAVLPQASAVITHAGHGTLSAALAHGLPVVMIPNDAADQPALAARTAQLGAGIHLTDDAATPATIADSVRAVLSEPSYAARAGELGERMRSYRARPSAVLAGILNGDTV